MRLSERDARLAELMDDPECDPRRLDRTLARFATVNRLVSCWGAVYRSLVRPALDDRRRQGASARPASILDIGCGGGDVLRRLVRLARRDGFEVEALGIDPDPRSLRAAERAAPVPGISFRRAGSAELVEQGARFDVVISNHLLHHLDDRGLDGLIADSEALAARLSAHSDIARSRSAYLAFSAGSVPLAAGSFIRIDGLRSIRRSYTPEELSSRLPPGWRVERPGAFRLLAVRRAPGPS